MCWYCSSFGFIPEDIEEVAADVVMKYFVQYKDVLQTQGLVGDMLESAIRRRMNRRVLLDVRTRYTTYTWPRYAEVTPQMEAGLVDLSDPCDLADLKQRLPRNVPAILIDYQQYGGDKSDKGSNSANDRLKFFRARKKFLHDLKG